MEEYIDLSGDGGVQKRILQEGTGDEKPSKGCSVSLHYTGTLDADGKKFDSSRDRNEPFQFTLGQGSVIKAFDMGVASMKLGEKCILKCAPQYAYGSSGSPPNIPPNATLNFELEILGWKGEDLSPKSDAGIQRFILKSGTGKRRPNAGGMVKIHLVGRHEGRVFEERDVEFSLDEGKEVGVVSGIELALEKFHKEETSRLILKPQYAFGAEGNAALGVPANATVEYTVTLQDFECLVERSMMSQEEMLAQAKLLREKGTKYLKEEKAELALKLYERALTYLFDQSAEAEAMKLAIYLNKILCLQKMKDHDEAKVACVEALNLDSKNVKALYRRGMSNLALGDLDRALQDFTAVLDIEPENKAALNQVTICKHKIKEYNDQQKKVFANMFTKFAQSDSKKAQEEQSRQPDVMKQKFGEWGDDEREHEPTRFEQENPDVIMLNDLHKQFRNM
ncbi:FK506-binding protein 59 [Anopheles ziemanni]|uniref:FK506-binding protein 59 n=1 Tax=Anopheles coustani TaxID=139045 RepID=UPI00265A29CB|nr:FK506-binding protein 59 [Anopheles coustani]XP_058125508.1 FK506-binding protein 59 [Anopheles coustani]XP_058167885.1 FK506-binding protein 59 [Anopheles ziemanni]